MESVYEKLVKYFESNSNEQIQQDWKEFEKWDTGNRLTIDEFMEMTELKKNVSNIVKELNKKK